MSRFGKAEYGFFFVYGLTMLKLDILGREFYNHDYEIDWNTQNILNSLGKAFYISVRIMPTKSTCTLPLSYKTNIII